MDSSSNLQTLDEGLVELANRLLQQFHLPTSVTSVEDIGAAVFVTLFEGLCGDRIPGVVRHPITREDEIHNVQLVLDSLAADVLRISLTHIRAAGIVSGNRPDVANMLEIFSGLSEYILNKIESDISTDNEDLRSGGRLELEDPDQLRPEVIDDILDRELQRGQSDLSGCLTRSEKRERTPVAPREAWPQSLGGTMQGAGGQGDPPAGTRSPPCAGRNSGGRAALGEDRWAKRRLTPSRQAVPDLGQAPGKETGPPAPSFSRTYPTRDRVASPVLDRPYSRTYPLRDQPLLSEGDVGRQGALPLDQLMQAADARLREAGSLLNGVNTSCNKSELNTTAELIREGELWERRLQSQPANLELADLAAQAGTGQKAEFDFIGQRPAQRPGGRQPEAVTGSPGMAATMPPAVGQRSTELRPDRSRPSTGILPHHRDSSSDRPGTSLGARDLRTRGLAGKFDRTMSAKGLSASYDDLQSLVERTAALARAAVSTSPIRGRVEHDTSPEHSFHSYRCTARSGLDHEDHLLARDLNLPGSAGQADTSPSRLAAAPHTRKVQTSPSRIQRKVSFLDKSPSSTDGSPAPRRARSSSSRKENVPPRLPTAARLQGPRHTEKRAQARYGSNADLGYISDHEGDRDKDAVLRRRFFTALESPREMDGRPPTRGGSGRKVQAGAGLGKKQPARGVLARTRRQLLAENAASKKKTQYLQKVYREDLAEFAEEAAEELRKSSREAVDKEKEVKEKVKTTLKPADRNKLPKDKKSVLVKKPRATVSTKVSKRSRAAAGSCRPRVFSVADDEDLMPALLEEFPHLHLSEHTWHELWRKGIHQIEQLTRAYEENRRKRSHAQVQLSEAEKKHQVLTHIVKKQMDHVKRMRELKEQKAQQVAVRNKSQEKRMQSARARKYYDEYQVRMRSKMLKRRTREEMVFKRLFQESLAIQKQRIQDIRKYASEQRERHASQRNNDITSLENYYRDQFEMLAERLAEEKKDLVHREKAQQKVLEQMKRELRRKMESEIQNFQDQLFRDEDDAYFRQADADRVRHRLQMAAYQTKV